MSVPDVVTWIVWPGNATTLLELLLTAYELIKHAVFVEVYSCRVNL
jgi:hypothetical protein